MSFRKILCAVDFSDTSHRAMEHAAELCRSAPGATLTLLHVSSAHAAAALAGSSLGTPLLSGLSPGGGFGRTNGDEARAEDDRLRSWQHELEAQQIPCTQPELAYGDPATEILKMAQDGGFDLIILGTHGKTGVLGALLGGVTYKVVRTASCSVLTVRS